jgi:two-component system CheB/CheR fusion protein
MARRLPQPAPKKPSRRGRTAASAARPVRARGTAARRVSRIPAGGEKPASHLPQSTRGTARPPSAAATIPRLERELSRARAELQATVEALEASNEELRSSNEELASTNEALASANEELQSTNEELHVSQEEIQSINDELAAVNAQLLQQAQLVHLSHDAILIRRFDGTIEAWNRGSQRLYGYTAEEVIGRRTHDVLGTVHPKLLAEIEHELRRTGSWAGELVHRTKDGRQVTVLTNMQLAHDEHGVARILEANRDFTDRKRAEEETRRSERLLRDADRRRNEFLAVLSHELRNPLAPIKNGLYILDHAAPDGEQARRARAVMNRQVEQLARLVDDLLDVTRITRGKVQLQPVRVELNELVGRALEDHRSLLEQGGLRCEVKTAPGAVLVQADANRLAQVIGNLLSNSAKFTPRGGHVWVAVSTDASAGQAVIRVADDGLGMAPEMVERLFEPFTQADATLDRSNGGLGLGLALVKGLVELHGGTVAGASEGLGRGSAFTLRLPLDRAGRAADPGSRDGEPLEPRRVLVVEDNVDAAESLREVLEMGRHVVEVAHDGAQGTALARTFQPDVVLCDIGLPGMDGYEVARTFRADPHLREVKLVALTGYAQPEDIARARAAGFDAHVAKPPSIERLEEILRCRARSPAPA